MIDRVLLTKPDGLRRAATNIARVEQQSSFRSSHGQGNRTSVTTGSATQTYTIDAFNHVKTDGTYTYSYDAEGNRDLPKYGEMS